VETIQPKADVEKPRVRPELSLDDVQRIAKAVFDLLEPNLMKALEERITQEVHRVTAHVVNTSAREAVGRAVRKVLEQDVTVHVSLRTKED
jgi:hypothetical protein